MDVTLAIWGGEWEGQGRGQGDQLGVFREHPGRGRCLGQGRGRMQEAQRTQGQARGAVCLLEVAPECPPITQEEERTPGVRRVSQIQTTGYVIGALAVEPCPRQTHLEVYRGLRV